MLSAPSNLNKIHSQGYSQPRSSLNLTPSKKYAYSDHLQNISFPQKPLRKNSLNQRQASARKIDSSNKQNIFGDVGQPYKRYVAASTYNPQLKDYLKNSNPRNMIYLRDCVGRSRYSQAASSNTSVESSSTNTILEALPTKRRTFERIVTISERDDDLDTTFQEVVLPETIETDNLAEEINNRLRQILKLHGRGSDD